MDYCVCMCVWSVCVCVAFVAFRRKQVASVIMANACSKTEYIVYVCMHVFIHTHNNLCVCVATANEFTDAKILQPPPMMGFHCLIAININLHTHIHTDVYL